jgi:hypothetical protein
MENQTYIYWHNGGSLIELRRPRQAPRGSRAPYVNEECGRTVTHSCVGGWGFEWTACAVEL